MPLHIVHVTFHCEQVLGHLSRIKLQLKYFQGNNPESKFSQRPFWKTNPTLRPEVQHRNRGLHRYIFNDYFLIKVYKIWIFLYLNKNRQQNVTMIRRFDCHWILYFAFRGLRTFTDRRKQPSRMRMRILNSTVTPIYNVSSTGRASWRCVVDQLLQRSFLSLSLTVRETFGGVSDVSTLCFVFNVKAMAGIKGESLV